MKTFRIFLLIIIVIGIGLIITQNLWVPKLVDFILKHTESNQQISTKITIPPLIKPNIGISALSTVSPDGATTSIVGSFTSPNGIYERALTLTKVSEIYIQSWGYGGGTNASGKIIPPGGFDPDVAIYDGTGPDAQLHYNDDDGYCPPGHIDTSTKQCSDSTINETDGLQPGNYTLVLLVAPSHETKEEDFEFPLRLGDIVSSNISFKDVFESLRTKNFAIDIKIVPAIPGP
jgi:hypothetical protein